LFVRLYVLTTINNWK